MPIQTQDIKLLKSDTMSDAPEGGGAMTGTVILDGESNNIFEDISTLDRVYGAVHMRKVYPAVQIQTQDKYFGSHVIISKLPGDQKIGVNLFSTEDWFDRRPSAQTRVENYLAKGANYSGFLWATQWKDSKVVTIFQGENAPIPGVGDVLYLTQSSDTQTQFVKITKIEESVQEFTDAGGIFKRRILALEISQALDYDFVGAQISRLDTITPSATIKQTVVANAAKYYSARPLADSAADTELSIKVDSVYSQVIPSSQQELAIIDADANGTVVALVESASGTVSFTSATNFAANTNVYLGSPCKPGTLSIAVSGGTLTDDGGQVKSGGTTVVGTINYAAGTITFGAGSPTYTGTKTVTFEPSAAPVKIADTGMLAVTAANRGYVWTYNISPTPKPGSVQVSYRALGNWYTLYDNGGGGLFGQESGIGSGTVNYITGSIAVTFAALPDADSEIIFSWARDARYYNRSNISPDPMKVTYQLAQTGIARGTLVISWTDGTAKTATADNNGVITGDATGTINHATGKLEFFPATLPLGGTQYTVDYQWGPPLSQTFNAPVKDGNGDLVLDLSTSGLVENSLELTWNVTPDALAYKSTIDLLGQQSINGFKIVKDDGLGALQGIAGSSVNYAGGIITFDPDVYVNMPVPTYALEFKGYEPGPLATAGALSNPRKVYSEVYTGLQDVSVFSPFPQDGSGSVTVLYRTTDSPTAAQEIITLNSLEIDLTSGYAEAIVPSSVRFKLGSSVYVDRLGQLYSNINATTGAGTYSGTIDYTTGNIVITSWPTGAANTITLQSLSTELGKEPVTDLVFRIPSAPVKTQSMQIRAVPADGGGQLSATADATGYITGTDIDGWITYETGVVFLRFGAWIPAAGNEAESWYDVDAIDENGNIFKPRHVYADTMLYNAVSQTFIPLDSSILGLNPVRLPQDGRIPVFAPGDVIVVLHDQKTIGTYSNATQTDLGRGRIAKLSVRDSANQEILNTRYTADLDAGLIDWVDLSGVSQPLTITDRIEDMAVLTDVQITGLLSLSQPLTHNFPAAETLVANAVIFNDLYARTSVPFDQQTWTGVWSDILIGSQVAAQYNNAQYPITVDNASAIQERWQIIFTSASLVHVIGEHVGQILTSVSINADIAPINPNTGQPFFTIPLEGWGSGWSSGNVLRFNTIAANAPVWIIQSVGQGEATDTDYTFCIEVRGDIDTP